ncbi:antibiotic synthesis protein MbtH [Micromonospora rosaria]|uniref:Antibiotic synthesis protein MbtH n=1 Tax=Micromonospora rosaria TaxID=47874 RepID=A0A136PZL0_9ACTN|nr:MbtH family protein [Micromonospora rosaria]KXK63880.1 antibiotic synthesis protein MbtH [Micromonospora rosaria]
MSHTEDGSTIRYKVVVNHEEQYSIWPVDRDNPLGWQDVGHSGDKESCLAHIREIWPDITPRSVREALRNQATT